VDDWSRYQRLKRLHLSVPFRALWPIGYPCNCLSTIYSYNLSQIGSRRCGQCPVELIETPDFDQDRIWNIGEISNTERNPGILRSRVPVSLAPRSGLLSFPFISSRWRRLANRTLALSWRVRCFLTAVLVHLIRPILCASDSAPADNLFPLRVFVIGARQMICAGGIYWSSIRLCRVDRRALLRPALGPNLYA